MSGAIDANAKPLPVVLKAARDELLSSWLARHARFYGVTGSFREVARPWRRQNSPHSTIASAWSKSLD